MIFDFWNDSKICETLSKYANTIEFDQEYCYHRPPLEIALKIVGNKYLHMVYYLVVHKIK